MTSPQGTMYQAQDLYTNLAEVPNEYALDAPTATSHLITITETIRPPSWARYTTAYLDVVTASGATNTVDLAFSYVDPVSGNAVAFPGSGITQIVAAGTVIIGFDPIAADDDTGPIYTLHCPPNVPLQYALKLGTIAEDEIQTLELNDIGAADTFKLTFNGHETADAITYSADMTAAIQAGLESLVDFVPGDVTVTQTDTNSYPITFPATGNYGMTDVGAITITTPTGFTPTGVTETNKGVVGDEVYALTLSFFFSAGVR